MRLSDRHKQIVQEMESDGYVWLSHMPANAIMRFRNKTRTGFTGFIKIEGLTFLTKRVANQISRGCKGIDRRRLTYKEQVLLLEKDLVQLEKELYQTKGIGARKVKRRYKSCW